MKTKMNIVAMFATKMYIAAVPANVGIKIASHFAFRTNPIPAIHCLHYQLFTTNPEYEYEYYSGS